VNFGVGDLHWENKSNEPNFSPFSPMSSQKTWNIGTKLFSALQSRAYKRFFVPRGWNKVELGLEQSVGMGRCLSFRIKLNDAGLGVEEFHYTVERYLVCLTHSLARRQITGFIWDKKRGRAFALPLVLLDSLGYRIHHSVIHRGITPSLGCLSPSFDAR
jgi:hypothetical protein